MKTKNKISTKELIELISKKMVKECKPCAIGYGWLSLNAWTMQDIMMHTHWDVILVDVDKEVKITKSMLKKAYDKAHINVKFKDGFVITHFERLCDILGLE